MADETREARARYARGALEGLARSAEDLLGKASRLAPVEEGTLRASGTVVLIVNGARFEGAGAKAAARSAIEAAARAGGPIRLDAEVAFNTVYAARQHEELDWQHPLGGQAKYLETPLRANASRYERIVETSAKLGL